MTPKEVKTARRSKLARKPNRSGAVWLGRTPTWLLTLTIVVLSLVPPSLRPITPLPHKGEHFAIFMIWGMAFALGYRINLIYQLVCAVFFTGAIEFAQYWVPGRHARISDLVVDTGAAYFGVIYAQIFSGWIRPDRSRQQSVVRSDLRQRTSVTGRQIRSPSELELERNRPPPSEQG
jgi:VanZ family protein